MTAPNPNGWQSSLRGIAATAVLVAMGFYLAVSLIAVIAAWLVLIAIVVAVVYGVVCFERYRRSRW
jgi:hypothetical protein